MTVRKTIQLTLTFSFLFSLSAHAQQSELVILLHGLGRGKSIMTPLKERLDKAGYATAVVDYKSIGRTPQDILADAAGQITAFRSDTVKKVHMVGHSLGGLLIRAYLDSIRVPNLGRVILIGSPSKGTPIVDYFRDSWLIDLAGPIAKSLGTDERSFPRTLGIPYYPVGIIAGISTTFNNDNLIPGEDDGIVPVESTKIEGMTDFISVPVSHSSMPKNETVGMQVIEFLTQGRFSKQVPSQQK
jgi:pimeloyl-ACP methyl ester carboxylesterase